MNKEKYKETTFFGMLKINGISLIWNYSLLYSLLFFILIHFFITGFNINSFDNYQNIFNELYTKILSISSTVFGIIIAALAVSMSIFNQKIISALESNKLLHKFLFPFWFLIVCWGILIFISAFIPMVAKQIISEYPTVVNCISGFSIWLFTYSLFFSINITGLLIRLFIQNSKVK